MNAKSNKSIPKSILDQLSALRSRLTQWLVVRGLSRWLLIVIGVLLLDVVIDRVFRMDFSQRCIMLGVMVIVAAMFFFWRLLKPLAALPSNDALLYEVEKGNASLQESLISSVELSRVEDFESVGVSKQLAASTIEKGIENAKQIDFGEIVDQTKHRKNLGLLGAGVIGLLLLGIGVASTNFLGTWFNRNIMLGSQQWPQGTYLEIDGVNDGKIIVPRGTNHRQFVSVTEASSVTAIDVDLEIENAGGGRPMIYSMKPTGKKDGRQHAFVFNNVSSSFRFRATGGDDTTEWVTVELVEPPAIVKLDMNVNLPSYTGVEPVSIKGDGPHPVLAGSSLAITATTNKPLQSAILKTDETEFPMSLSEDGLTFTASPGKNSPLISGPYRFELLDEGGLSNARKSKFTISLKEDAPPRVRAELLGISGIVSSRAQLPTEYQAADEYGLTKIGFEANWKVENTDEDQPSTEATIATLEQQQSQPWLAAENVAVFDLLPLQLKPGTSLRLAVAASDNRPETPGIGKSQEFLMRIVSDEELRADLLRREDEQRKAFQQAYEIQLTLATELETLTITEPTDGQSAEDFYSQRELKLLRLVRDQKGIGTAIDRIASRFEEFLVEIHNNRLTEAEKEIAPGRPGIEERYSERIIEPIRALDGELVTAATQRLDSCRRVQKEVAKLNQAATETIETQQLILERMKVILKAMNDSRSFQDLINGLLEIKSLEDEIQIESANQAKPKEPKGVFDEDEVFDQ